MSRLFYEQFSAKYISPKDSTYLKGWAILIMIFLHVFGSRAVNLPAYSNMQDIYVGNEALSYGISKFCSICVHLYIFLSGYGFYIIYRRKLEKGTSMHTLQRIVMLLTKVLLIGAIFYPISYFFPALGWESSLAIQLLLGYKGNYEWWFLRPYIAIGLLSPYLMAFIDKKPCLTFCLSLSAYFLIKALLYLDIRYAPLIVQQVLILSPPLFLGALLAKYGVLAVASGLSANKKFRFISWCIIILMIIYKYYFPAGIFDFIICTIFISCIIIVKDSFPDRLKTCFVKLGEEATSMWLIHSFISVYYFSDLTYSFKYPIFIFLFVVATSFILSKFINGLYNPIKQRVEHFFV